SPFSVLSLLLSLSIYLSLSSLPFPIIAFVSPGSDGASLSSAIYVPPGLSILVWFSIQCFVFYRTSSILVCSVFDVWCSIQQAPFLSVQYSMSGVLYNNEQLNSTQYVHS
ncbi:unnamed protein product, partial [Candidula unifasciata]